MSKIAFLGLGQMGAPMAGRLLEAGHDVTVLNRTSGRADSPVRGSVAQATDGTLQVMVGATDQDLGRVQPILEVLGTVHHIGAPGSGAAMKLVANSTLGAAMMALGEGLALGESLGLAQAA